MSFEDRLQAALARRQIAPSEDGGWKITAQLVVDGGFTNLAQPLDWPR